MRSEKGFTLVEIAIVLAVIGILTIIASSNLQSWTNHNKFVGFQREVFSELQEARTRAVAKGLEHLLLVQLDTNSVAVQEGNAANGSGTWTTIRSVDAAAGGGTIASVTPQGPTAPPPLTSGTATLRFSPTGEVTWPGASVDTADILFSNVLGESKTIRLFCWTGKARLQ